MTPARAGARPLISSIAAIWSGRSEPGTSVPALNLGSGLGGFAHDTGEGVISPYQLEHSGDLVWEIGTGYFGARTDDGDFDPAQFRDQSARDQVKSVSLKLSQGAKPGIGGVLPAAKGKSEI